ncbi:Emopamil-binding protein [Pilobolus umbonatus]|nr:Emopamil-binding protein [Pilobolus umbonatus]
MTHPYYPPTLLLPHYTPNDKSTTELLLIMGSLFMAVVMISYCSSKTLSKHTTSPIRFTWFIVCSLLHMGFEGYWLWYRETIAGRNDVLAQLWKEYALGDSRYLSSDELLLTLEKMTIFIWGPLCFMSSCSIWGGSPKQYLFQLMASMCHLFSCSLYFIMDLPDAIHCVPQPLYFWIYFITFNLPWIVVPSLLLQQSIQHYIAAVSIVTNKKDI